MGPHASHIINKVLEDPLINHHIQFEQLKIKNQCINHTKENDINRKLGMYELFSDLTNE